LLYMSINTPIDTTWFSFTVDHSPFSNITRSYTGLVAGGITSLTSLSLSWSPPHPSFQHGVVLARASALGVCGLDAVNCASRRCGLKCCYQLIGSGQRRRALCLSAKSAEPQPEILQFASLDHSAASKSPRWGSRRVAR
jgi:hypothetical protein